MASSIRNVGAPHTFIENAFSSFGKNILASKKISTAVSVVFGAILAKAVNIPVGLLTAATGYLLTEHLHMKGQLESISELKGQVLSLELVRISQIGQIVLLMQSNQSLVSRLSKYEPNTAARNQNVDMEWIQPEHPYSLYSIREGVEPLLIDTNLI